MKKHIWWIFCLLSCGDSSQKIDPKSQNSDTILKSDSLNISKPKVKEIEEVPISFSCVAIRGVGSSNLKTYRQWPTNNFIITQDLDTMTVKFNALQGRADWQGNILIRGDSLILIHRADLETMTKSLWYYEFIYKVKNPDKKQFQIRTTFAY